ncbi:hypothetical protein GCK72_021129 [Caenorhabditis remanei]|uniref:HAT C-terminal dimerisation domain-containing protein n=1 Tax=Caenorhabditis remanei TaxID=31234 RepID=A0A6A5GIV5_CAERE|nr:hypothetical protein GCK72_021129 [Caenorhabditis remanei]KAF1754566.1 hypothetical protein GCK72_021129 [Caenorhabditis remanei]
MDMLPKDMSSVRNSPAPTKNDGVEDLYLCEHVDSNYSETLENYWHRKKNEYPALYEAATKLFSVIPSESICESCFSTASYLLDKRRTRLQYSKAELVVMGCQLANKFPHWLDDLA